MSNDLIEIEMQMHSHTQKAILVSDDGDDDSAVWLPVSQIQTRDKGGARMIVTMPEWLAMKEGLI